MENSKIIHTIIQKIMPVISDCFKTLPYSFYIVSFFFSFLFQDMRGILFVSGGIISVSYLTKKDDTVNILMFHSVISSFLVFLIFYKGISFDISDNFFYLILMTLTALLGQYFNTESYRNEKANIIIVVSYSRIIFSTVLGFLILDEKIDLVSLLGIMIIIFTTFFVKKYSVNNN